MSDTFGAKLRQHREQRGISLKSVADQTKIKLSLLDGLERDDISQWPVGIFRRAYVRAYAHAVGLDTDLVVREFFELYPEPPVEPINSEPAPPPGLRGRLGSALGSFARRRRDPVVEAPLVPPTEQKSERLFDPPVAVAPPARPEAVATKGTVAAEPVETPAPPVPPAPVVSGPEIDLLAAAKVCTELGRVDSSAQVEQLLLEAARILDARGLIVWVWDALSSELKPALVHGYSDRVKAQLPGVRRDDDNVTAVAFRTGQPCAINGSDKASSALAIPLLTPGACAGVLAIELPHGHETVASVRAVATFFAAMLAQLVPAEAQQSVEPPQPVEAEQSV